jgi:hypothetical protein
MRGWAAHDKKEKFRRMRKSHDDHASFHEIFLLSPLPPTHPHLDARVANGTATQIVQARAVVVSIGGQNRRIPSQDTLVPVEVHSYGETGDGTGP